MTEDTTAIGSLGRRIVESLDARSIAGNDLAMITRAGALLWRGPDDEFSASGWTMMSWDSILVADHEIRGARREGEDEDMDHPNSRQTPGDRAWALPKAIRRVLLLAPPLALAALEIVHPQPDETVQALMDASTWFAGFHVIQLALTGFVALSVLLLADNFGRANAWVTRLGLGVFLVFFSAYDAVAGIATGLAMRNARELSAVQQEGVFDAVKDWPAVGPPFALSIVGTLGWVAAVGALALAARRQGAPRGEWVLIGLAAAFLLGGHPFPAGTLAFGCFFSAALLHEVRAARLRPQQSRERPRSR